jgi:hypothetical protein
MLKDSILHQFFIPPSWFIQEQSSYAPCMSQSCQISGFLLADHHFGVPEHGSPSNGTLSTTRMAGFLPRYTSSCLLWHFKTTIDFLSTDVTNIFFIVLFAFEMLLKMYSLGFQVRIMKKFEKLMRNARFSFFFF